MVGKQIKTIGWHGSRKHSFMKRPLIQEIISKILKEARKYIKVKYINFACDLCQSFLFLWMLAIVTYNIYKQRCWLMQGYAILLSSSGIQVFNVKYF